MPDPEHASTAMEIAKLLGPYLGGGMLGAIFTFAANRVFEKTRRPSLSIESQTVDYSLEGRERFAEHLRVSYRGEVFDRLTYYELQIRNTGSRSVAEVPVVVAFGASSQILDQDISSSPLVNLWTMQNDGLAVGQRKYVFRDVQAGDSIRLGVIVSQAGGIESHFRGADDVRIDSYHGADLASAENDWRRLAAFAAMFVMSDFVPLVGSLIQALVILGAAPHLFRFVNRRRMTPPADSLAERNHPS